MNSFFWNLIVLACAYNLPSDAPQDQKCISYMTDCFMERREDRTPRKFLRCQTQWMQIQKSYKSPARRCETVERVRNGSNN